MELGLKYDLELIEDVNNILEKDFWVYCNLTAAMIPKISDPIKFTSSVSILVTEGECNVDIDLISHKVTAPCFVNIKKGQILQFDSFSDNLKASFIVLSKRFCDNLFILIKDSPAYGSAALSPVISIPRQLVTRFERFYEHIKEIFDDSKGTNAYQAMTLAIASFFYECGTQCYPSALDRLPKGANRIAEKFVITVQQNFKKERFLEFYADSLGVTTKHLSRTVKEITGFTAVEWIDRYVILEAKVLLKSSTLTIQQISDELNFKSQSFFGKYFKKHTGITPKNFRNS